MEVSKENDEGDRRDMFNIIKRNKDKKQNKGYTANDIEIPIQFYVNGNGETCFRETVGGKYKIDRNGNVVRYR